MNRVPWEYKIHLLNILIFAVCLIIYRYSELMKTEVQKVETRIKQKQERVCIYVRIVYMVAYNINLDIHICFVDAAYQKCKYFDIIC